MDAQAVVDHFGGTVRTANALGCTHGAVSQWLAEGRIPPLRQWQVAWLTNGRFAAPEPCGAYRRPAA